jgi:hypothetical protein
VLIINDSKLRVDELRRVWPAGDGSILYDLLGEHGQIKLFVWADFEDRLRCMRPALLSETERVTLDGLRLAWGSIIVELADVDE